MKNILSSLLAVVLVTGILPAQEKQVPPQGGTPKNFTLPEKEVVQLDNGLQLVMVPYGSIPKASIQISIKTGNINEGEDQVWLSDLMAIVAIAIGDHQQPGSCHVGRLGSRVVQDVLVGNQGHVARSGIDR